MPFLCALGLTGVTVLVHTIGTLGLILLLAGVRRRRRGRQPAPLASAFEIVGVVTALLLLHFLEAGAWAAFYSAAELLPDVATAFSFSLTNYTTVGYGDVILPVRWRILGPFEAAAGILMFGWSTAVMVTTVTRVYGSRLRLQTGVTGEGNVPNR